MNNLLMNKEIAFNKLIGNTYLKRIIEVALTGQHSITVIGNTDNGLKHIKEIFKARDFEDPIFNENLLTFVEPCPCGNYTDPLQECNCSLESIAIHRNSSEFKQAMKSDLVVKLETPCKQDFNCLGESFETVYKRIEQYSKGQENFLHHLSQEILDVAQDRLHLTICKRERLLLVANTIANMDNSGIIQPWHLSEVIGYHVNITK